MKKIMFIFTTAGIATFSLFAFMAYLITNEQMAITQPPPDVVVEFAQLPEETKPEEIPRKQFQPPIPPPVMEVSKLTPELTEVSSEYSYSQPKIDLISNTLNLVTMGSAPDQDARPIVRVNPKYPIDALRNGTQGWVKLAFDISEIGEVINIKVIDSQPKRVFDKAAKQALKKWKYKAKSMNGKQIQQQSLTVQLDFNMEQQI